MAKAKAFKTTAAAADNSVEQATLARPRPFTRAAARKERAKLNETVALAQQPQVRRPRARLGQSRPPPNKSRSRRVGFYRHLPTTPPGERVRARFAVRRHSVMSVVASDDGLSDTDGFYEMDDTKGDISMDDAEGSAHVSGPSVADHNAQIDAGLFPAGDRPDGAQQPIGVAEVAEVKVDIDGWYQHMLDAAPQAANAGGQDRAAFLHEPGAGLDLQAQQPMDFGVYNELLPGGVDFNQQFFGAGQQHLNVGAVDANQLDNFGGNSFYAMGNHLPAGFAAQPFVGMAAQPFVAGPAQPFLAAPSQPFAAAPAQPYAVPNGMNHLWHNNLVQGQAQQPGYAPYALAAVDEEQRQFNDMVNRISAEISVNEASVAGAAPLGDNFSVSSTLRSASPPSIASALGPINVNQPQAGPSRLQRSEFHVAAVQQPIAPSCSLYTGAQQGGHSGAQPQAGPSIITQPQAGPSTNAQPQAGPSGLQPQAGPSGQQPQAGPSGSHAPSVSRQSHPAPQANADPPPRAPAPAPAAPADGLSDAARTFDFGPRIPRPRAPHGRRYKRSDGVWVDEIVGADPLFGFALVDGRRLPVPRDGLAEITLSWRMQYRPDSGSGSGSKRV